MKEADYVSILADLINHYRAARERERRVREANRRLYREVVAADATDTQADLALARAACAPGGGKGQ